MCLCFFLPLLTLIVMLAFGTKTWWAFAPRLITRPFLTFEENSLCVLGVQLAARSFFCAADSFDFFLTDGTLHSGASGSAFT